MYGNIHTENFNIPCMKLKILLLALLAFVSGCNNNDAAIQNDLEKATDRVPVEEANSSEFPEPMLITTDDSVAYQFQKTQIAPDLFLQKNIELKKSGEGTIILNFSGDGEGEYIEVIPKTFAVSVADINFSIEPDEIINDDPIVKWKLGKANQKIQKIVMKVTETALAKGTTSYATQLGQTDLGKLLTGEGPDLSKVMRKAQIDGALAGGDVLIDHLDDFLFAADIQVCSDKTDPENRVLCLLKLISKKPDWFDCNDVFDAYDFSENNSNIMALSCKAIQKDDPGMCKGVEFYDSEFKGTEASYKAMCERQFFAVKLDDCNGISGTAQEQCVIDKIKGTGFTEGCDTLSGTAADKCRVAAGSKQITTTETLDDDVSDIATNVPDMDAASSDAEPSPSEKNCSLESTENLRNSCYKSEAKKTGKLSLCDMIVKSSAEDQKKSQEACYGAVAVETKNCEICHQLEEGKFNWRECINQCSTNAGDASLCDAFIYDSQHAVEDCKGSVAERTEDASICDTLTLEFDKDNCYKKVATRTNDVSLCNKISSASEQEFCKEYAIPR